MRKQQDSEKKRREEEARSVLATLPADLPAQHALIAGGDAQDARGDGCASAGGERGSRKARRTHENPLPPLPLPACSACFSCLQGANRTRASHGGRSRTSHAPLLTYKAQVCVESLESSCAIITERVVGSESRKGKMDPKLNPRRFFANNAKLDGKARSLAEAP